MNKQNTILPILLLFTFLCIKQFLFARENSSPDDSRKEQDLYQSRLLQFNFLLNQNPSPADSLIIILKQEADFFANEQDWQIAIDLIDEALFQLTLENESVADASPSVSDNLFAESLSKTTYFPDTWNWSVELGSDYSRQEYELNYVESDSAVLEELNNPFISLQLSKMGNSGNNEYSLYQYVRSDQNLLQSNTTLALESNNLQTNWRIEGQSELYVQYDQSRGNFWENQFRGFFNTSISHNFKFYLNSQTRFKYHFSPDSTFGNIFASEITTSVRHYFKLLSWLEFLVRPSFYHENQVNGYRYFQLHSKIGIVHKEAYNQFFSLYTNYYFRRFKSKNFDEEYSNTYHDVEPTLEAETPLISPFGISAKVIWESRRYKSPEISHTNFSFLSVNSQLKFYLNESVSFGAGYVLEKEVHSDQNIPEENLVKQENFDARGFIISADVFQLNGLLISLAYQFTRRTYPNGGLWDLTGFYSNRNVNSIIGIGYIPLSSHWQFQFFANYDNDKDRDRNNNDNFNTIFNLGFVYKF